MTSYDAVIAPTSELAEQMNRLLPPSLRRWLTRLLMWVTGIAVAVALLLAVLLLGSIQSQALQIAPPTGSKAQVAQVLRQTPLLQTTLRGELASVTLPLDGLNALFFDLIQRAMGGQGALKLTDQSRQNKGAAFDVLVSIPTSRTPLKVLPGDYWLNIQTRWTTQANGQIQLDKASLGQLPLPTSILDLAFKGLLVWQDWSELKNIAVTALQRIDVSDKQLTVDWQLNDELQAQLFETLIPPDQLDRIHAYQMILVETLPHVALQPNGYVPLLPVLQPMFKAAQDRTLGQQLSPESRQRQEHIPILENRALLLALTLHAIGVQPSELIPQARDWPQALPRLFTLRGRVDFAQHYLISALLASGVGGRLTDLIGIYKEQSDKVSGSGFSFNDIAADRAGNRFGQRARLDGQTLQARVQESNQEDFFMPDVSDMPQFLTAKEFEKRFSGPNAKAYDQIVIIIDQRIDQLGVLQ